MRRRAFLFFSARLLPCCLFFLLIIASRSFGAPRRLSSTLFCTPRSMLTMTVNGETTIQATSLSSLFPALLLRVAFRGRPSPTTPSALATLCNAIPALAAEITV